MNKIAEKLSDWLATMACFYAITFLTLSILFFQAPTSPLEWVQYIVQTFFQGVALPVLAFVAKISGARQERLLQETHDATMAQLLAGKETRIKILQDTQLLKGGVTELVKMHKRLDELCTAIHANTTEK